MPARRRVHRLSLPTAIVALAMWVGCDEPQGGSPGLEPPREVDDAGASGSAAGRGGSTSMAGGAGTVPVTPPPTVGGSGAGSAAGAPSEPDTIVDSPSCEPVGETLDVYAFNERGENCDHPPAPESGVPNFESTWIQDLPLTTPLEPGQPYAITLSPSNNGMRGATEIWGSDDA